MTEETKTIVKILKRIALHLVKLLEKFEKGEKV